MPEKPSVLISGASVAGPVLAYWLHRFGFRPTVIERTTQPRFGTGGHAVDLFGPAVDLMGWMGLLSDVELARTETKVIALVRPHRRPVAAPAEMLSEGVAERHIEIMRGDLARIFYEATRDDVAYVFDDSIATLQDDGHRVQVTFERGAPETFDLLVGADGLHSITRRLIFGPEEKFLRFLGGYLAVFTVPNYLHLQERMLGFSVPGRTAGIYPIGDRSQARVVLLWRAPHLQDYDRHDGQAQRQLVRSLYGDLGWELPRLLAELDRSEDLYLDSISQVVMDTWTSGRVALIGDAGYSPGAAVGGGTSLAIIGAYLLASELVKAHGDYGRGFAAYERALEPVVRHSRSVGPTAMKVIIPESRQLIWLAAQAMRLLPHIPAPLRRRVTAFGGSAAAMLNAARLTHPDELPRLNR
ncbi:MAG TPA: FAD-dependent monooxygenase [Propionibacteriaceae bacterium]|nr:FAD-dependent monooxygenase [Propionibacteriaceae bacterium]